MSSNRRRCRPPSTRWRRRAVRPDGPPVTLPASTGAIVGKPVQLVAQIKDKNGKTVTGVALTWLSADRSIATVDASGLVTPLRVGTTNVSAATGGASGSTVLAVSDSVASSRSRFVGTNLAGIAYYSAQFPFADMMKSGMGWVSREDNGTRDAPFPKVTADGYPAALKPGQHAVSAVAWNDTHYPAGRYVVLWEGEGAISFPMSSVTVAETSANRIAIDVADTSGQLWVSIDSTNEANPVRNLRFLWPGSGSNSSDHATVQSCVSRARSVRSRCCASWIGG